MISQNLTGQNDVFTQNPSAKHGCTTATEDITLVAPEQTQILGDMLSKKHILQARRLTKATRLTPKELQQLVVRVQAKDNQAIEQLCKEYEPMIKHLCSSAFIKNVIGYEDAVNYCYCYLLELIYDYQGNRWATLPGLIYLYCRHNLYRQLNKEVKYKDSFTSLYQQEADTGEDKPLEVKDDLAEISFDNAETLAILNQLPELEREILILNYLEQQSYKQIMPILNLTKDTFYTHRAKAIKHLKELLQA